MKLEKIRGIVLEEMLSGESSKHLTVLSRDKGKVRLYARGARKPKSKLMAGSQLFSYCDFLVYEGKGFLSVTQIDIIESFYGLRTQLDTLTEAAGLAHVMLYTCLPGENNDKSLKLLLKTLWLMSKKEYNPRLASVVFMWKHLQFAGLMPAAKRCAVCGCEILDSLRFNIEAGGLVCKKHIANSQNISPSAFEAMTYIFNHEDTKTFGFGVSQTVLNELYDLCVKYIKMHWNVVV